MHKIPIFTNDRDLIVPKCYTPTTDKYLNDQFERIFKHGDRFLLKLDKDVSIVVTQSQNIIHQSNLIVTKVQINDPLFMINGKDCLGIVSEGYIHLYESVQKGALNFKAKVKYEPTKKYYLFNKKLFSIGNTIEEFDILSGKSRVFSNINFDRIIACSQYNNILLIVTQDKLYEVDMSEGYNANIKYSYKEVFGLSFKEGINGLYQNIDGRTYIFNNVKGNIDTNLLRLSKIKDIYQNEDVGVISYEENSQIINKLFVINSLNKISLSPFNLENAKVVGYNGSLIAVAQDGKIKLLQKESFNTIAEFSSTIIHDDSDVFFTKAGIIAQTGKDIAILNTK